MQHRWRVHFPFSEPAGTGVRSVQNRKRKLEALMFFNPLNQYGERALYCISRSAIHHKPKCGRFEEVYCDNAATEFKCICRQILTSTGICLEPPGSCLFRIGQVIQKG